MTYIGVQLPNETGEVVMLEVFRQKVPCELRWVPHYEAIVVTAPRHDRVGGRVIHHIVSLAQERRWSVHIRNRRRSRLLSPAAAARRLISAIGNSFHFFRKIQKKKQR